MHDWNAIVNDLIQSLPVGRIGTIHEVHHDLGAIAGEHRVAFHNSLKSLLDEVICLADFEIHVESNERNRLISGISKIPGRDKPVARRRRGLSS